MTTKVRGGVTEGLGLKLQEAAGKLQGCSLVVDNEAWHDQAPTSQSDYPDKTESRCNRHFDHAGCYGRTNMNGAPALQPASLASQPGSSSDVCVCVYKCVWALTSLSSAVQTHEEYSTSWTGLHRSRPTRSPSRSPFLTFLFFSLLVAYSRRLPISHQIPARATLLHRQPLTSEKSRVDRLASRAGLGTATTSPP